MPYTTLSEQIKRLSNPQRSDVFVKRLRDAVREGELEAAELPQRFTLPKTYRRRGSDETATRDVREMVFEPTPEFEAWFARVDEELSAGRERRARVKPTLENIEAGAVDFRALAEETRRKLNASFEKGQTLGKSRAQTRAPSARPPAGPGASAAPGSRRQAVRLAPELMEAWTGPAVAPSTPPALGEAPAGPTSGAHGAQ